MCGLAAIITATQARHPVDPLELLRIRDQMTARGPDGAGLWIAPDGQVGLAHRRLAIIDLSPAGAQPMESTCGRARIVFNGEIYNYRALRAELEQSGVRFRSGSDTEVILELYLRYGRAMLERLRGMFAFSLWDEEKRGLLLARDPFGIKPLYLSDDGTTLRAASQVKALLAGRAIDTSPDPAGHAGFFLWGHVPEPHTLYRDIRPLPAGSWLWAGADGSRNQGRFFDLQGEMSAACDSPPPLRDALLDSVRVHLEADVPVGIFLSAGLDSVTLAALTRELATETPKTVTLGFSELTGSPYDEVPLAEAAARHYATDHATVQVSAADFAACHDRILTDMDQPSVDGVNTWLVARAARQRGLKVALSGLGGDEIFAGYDTFRRIPRLVRRLGPLAAVPALGRMIRVLTAPWIGRLASPKLAGVVELGSGFGDAYLLSRGMFMPWELDRVLESDMAREGLRSLRSHALLDEATKGIASDRLRISALEMQFYMRNQLLRDSDWAGMAHSLEIRVPLVDVELFRAVLALLAAGDAPSKRHMAESARPIPPAAILDRPKTGFFVPVAKWMGKSDIRGLARHIHTAFTTNHHLG